ncbi:Hydroxyacylglutathione hydrolase GloC [bacterium HR15]|nr:Hydroxyacylglutathione hydrolase GloC [bacterium HR15]
MREQPFQVEILTLGPLQANCYLVIDKESGQAVVIDPGCEPEQVAARLHTLSVSVALLLATHGHFDHVVGVPYLKRLTGAPFWMSRGEWELWAQYAHEHLVYLGLPPSEPVPHPDRFLQEGDEFQVGCLEFRVLLLKGHAPEHLGFLLQAKPLHLFCGDAIFAGSVGRTDIPYADHQTLREHLHTRVLTLPDDTLLLPGHGPLTTVGVERQTNPFL